MSAKVSLYNANFHVESEFLLKIHIRIYLGPDQISGDKRFASRLNLGSWNFLLVRSRLHPPASEARCWISSERRMTSSLVELDPKDQVFLLGSCDVVCCRKWRERAGTSSLGVDALSVSKLTPKNKYGVSYQSSVDNCGSKTAVMLPEVALCCAFWKQTTDDFCCCGCFSFSIRAVTDYQTTHTLVAQTIFCCGHSRVDV